MLVQKMKRLNFFAALFVVTILSYGQETVIEENKGNRENNEKPAISGFFVSLGENILSNTLLYMANRYIAEASWAQITPDSILENLSSPWEWDRDEYFTNQFGHPYQGSVYHAAARSNGFDFYQAFLFDAFGSVSWELFYETNAPSINDLISTTLGGAALGEIFHRLYLEIPNSFAPVVSPMDAFNGLVTRRRPQRTHNMYYLQLASGMGYTYAEQSVKEENDAKFFDLNAQHMVSADIACNVIYGNPFVQQSGQPYNHFELTLYTNVGYPLWYNLKLLSDAYLFSFSVFDEKNKQASTGLSLHYDLFADRHIDFFSQALDWTYKYRKKFNGGTEMEFKGHIGWNIFNADTFYVHNEYSGLRGTKNNYGTGTNIKLNFAAQKPRSGKFELKLFTYKVYNVFQNENKDSGHDICTFYTVDYSFPLGKQTSIGIAGSSLWHRAFYDRLPDTRKWTRDGKIYIAWEL
jgi:hypothetical protein